MTVKELNEAVGYIDEKYLDLADAPPKEILQMSKRKTISRVFLIAAVIAMLAVTAFAADFLNVKSLLSGTKTSYESFSQIGKAMKEAGFRMDVKERFSTGFSFEKASVKEVRGADENGKEVLTYSAISVFYKNKDGNRLVLSAEPEIAEISVSSSPIAQSKKIGTITADYTLDHYKMVPEDYELTEADKVWKEQPGNYLSYGSDEIEETEVGFLNWTKDGVRYLIMDMQGNEQPEVLFAMAEELILEK